MSAAMGFFSLGTQERVRDSRGKRATSVRAIEVLLYKNQGMTIPTSLSTDFGFRPNLQG